MKKVLLFFTLAFVGLSMNADNIALEVLEEFLDARCAESPIRYARAAKELARLAAEGHPVHQFVLAATSREADFPREVVISDTDREDYLIKNRIKIRALAEKNSSALYILALETNYVSRIREAVKRNNEYALNEYGVWLMNQSKFKNERMLRDSFNYFSRAAEKHNAAAIYNLGVCYQKGYGCEQNLASAIEHFERAAVMNYPKAMNALGEIYRDGGDGVEINVGKALEYFAECAASGNALGQYNYAMELFKIDGDTGTNDVKAVELLKGAARQRNLNAMVEYARCLYDDIGINSSFTNKLRGAELDKACETLAKAKAQRDHQAVSWWYHCANKLEYPPAMHYLGQCFLDGRGVDKNEVAAVLWFKRAADLGCIPAMISLAKCHEEGVGDLEKSHYNANWWKTRADAERGVRNARIWIESHSLK